MRILLQKYSSICQNSSPLTNLTKNNVDFHWFEQCQKAFEEFKHRLIEAPVLVRADIIETFVITTDFTSTHVGGVPSQTQSAGSERAMEYFSKKLKPAEVRYSATNREALAIVLTYLQFNNYL